MIDLVKSEEELEWEDLVDIWNGLKITLTETVKDEKSHNGLKVKPKKAIFQFESWEALKSTLILLAKDEKYVEAILNGQMEKYVNDEVDYDEEKEYWDEKAEEGWRVYLFTSSVTVFPKLNQIVYESHSFHHFFQHMLDWFPRQLDETLLSREYRDREMCRYIDNDTEIPVSRHMINDGFMIGSQEFIDEEFENSIKKFLIRVQDNEFLKIRNE